MSRTFSTRSTHLSAASRRSHNTRIGAAVVMFGATAVLAMASATAQVATAFTGADGSGNFATERAACLAGKTQQSQATCLEEARNAAADKRRGLIQDGRSDLAANQLRRCDVFSAGSEDRAACVARIQGQGEAEGNVASGGVVREVETIVLPASGQVVIQPQTADPVLLVPVNARY